MTTPSSATGESPSVPNPCSICGAPIFGGYIGTGDGTMKDGGSFAHPECYYRKASSAAPFQVDIECRTGCAILKHGPLAERVISYETLQERCNELLDSLRDIRDVVDSLALAKQIAAVVLDGDKIIW